MPRSNLTEDEIQERLDRFDAIILEHPRLDMIRRKTRSLIRQTTALRKRNQEKEKLFRGKPFSREEMYLMPIVGPSGSTKTTSMRRVSEEILRDPALGDDDIPIVTVKLDSVTRNTRLLQAQILAAYNDPGAEGLRTARDYSEASANAALRDLATCRNTSVIVLDEAHNMLGSDADSATTKSMRKALKSLVNAGVFSIIVMGTDECRVLFDKKEEFNRVQLPIDLGRFDIRNPEDREYFFGFVGLFEEQMVSDGVIDDRIGLIDSLEGRALTYDMADGVIGPISRILRQCVEAGCTTIDWDDLETAFGAWVAILSKEDPVRAYDPFERGARTRTLRHVGKDFPGATGSGSDDQPRGKKRIQDEPYDEDEDDEADEEYAHRRTGAKPRDDQPQPKKAPAADGTGGKPAAPAEPGPKQTDAERKRARQEAFLRLMD